MMTRILSGGVLALAIACAAALATPAAAQEAKTSNIKISYEEPQSPNLRPVSERLKKRQVLERVQKFLSPLKLPRELTVRTAQCGGVVIPYQAGQAVTLCYEYVAQVEKQAPPSNNIGFIGAAFVTRDMAIVGPIVHALLHDVSRTIFDMLEIPVWGNMIDAADHVAAFIMLQFGDQVARTAIKGTVYTWLKLSERGESPYWDTHSTAAQRYANYLCIAYGRDPALFKDLADQWLSAERAPGCAREYQRVLNAFNKTIRPHVDEALMQKVRQLPVFRPGDGEW